jgi:hypothetical protein
MTLSSVADPIRFAYWVPNPTWIPIMKVSHRAVKGREFSCRAAADTILLPPPGSEAPRKPRRRRAAQPGCPAMTLSSVADPIRFAYWVPRS